MRVHAPAERKGFRKVPTFPNSRQCLEEAFGVGLEQLLLPKLVEAGHHLLEQGERLRQVVHDRLPHLRFGLGRRARRPSRGRVAVPTIGGVAHVLGSDGLLLDRAGGGQRADDVPAEVCVDHQSVESDRPV